MQGRLTGLRNRGAFVKCKALYIAVGLGTLTVLDYFAGREMKNSSRGQHSHEKYGE